MNTIHSPLSFLCSVFKCNGFKEMVNISYELSCQLQQEDRENYIMRSLLIVPLTRYYYGDKINEDEMSGTFSMHMRYENAYKIF